MIRDPLSSKHFYTFAISAANTKVMFVMNGSSKLKFAGKNEELTAIVTILQSSRQK